MITTFSVRFLYQQCSFWIFVMAVLLGFFGCSESDDSQSPSVLNIVIDDALPLDLDEWCSRIELIPLETNSESVLTVDKITEFEGRYYISDRKQQALFVFDEDGAFLFDTRSLSGKGPGQYISLLDFDINPFTRSIEILSPLSMSVVCYDLSGSYKESVRLPRELHPLSNFSVLKDDVRVFYTKSNVGFLKYHTSGSNKLLYSTEELSENAVHLTTLGGRFPFIRVDSTLYFCHIFPDNKIYQLVEESTEPKMVVEVNMGEVGFTLECLPDNLEKRAYSSFFTDHLGDYAFVMNISGSDSLWLFHIAHKDEMFVVKFDRNIQETKVGRYTLGIFGQMPPPQFARGNSVYFVCPPEALKYVISANLLDDKSKSILSSVHPEDNPVLVRYYFR